MRDGISQLLTRREPRRRLSSLTGLRLLIAEIQPHRAPGLSLTNGHTNEGQILRIGARELGKKIDHAAVTAMQRPA